MMLQICKEQRAVSAAQPSGHTILKATVQPGASTEAKPGEGLAGVPQAGGGRCLAGRGAPRQVAGRLGLAGVPVGCWQGGWGWRQGLGDSQSHFLPRRLEGHWPEPSGQLGVCWEEKQRVRWVRPRVVRRVCVCVLMCACVCVLVCACAHACMFLFVPFSELRVGQGLRGAGRKAGEAAGSGGWGWGHLCCLIRLLCP